MVFDHQDEHHSGQKEVTVGVAMGLAADQTCVSFDHDISVSESSKRIHVQVVRTSHTWGGTARYSTVDGTAIAGQQYDPVAGAIHFGKRDHLRRIGIRIHNNQHVNDDKTFELLIDGLIVVDGDDSITITVIDDD